MCLKDFGVFSSFLFPYSLWNNCACCVSFLHCQSDWMGTDQEGCDHHSNGGRRLRTTVKFRYSNSSRNLTVHGLFFWFFFLSQRGRSKEQSSFLDFSQPVRPEPFQLHHLFLDQVKEIRGGSLDSHDDAPNLQNLIL